MFKTIGDWLSHQNDKEINPVCFSLLNQSLPYWVLTHVKFRKCYIDERKVSLRATNAVTFHEWSASHRWWWFPPSFDDSFLCAEPAYAGMSHWLTRTVPLREVCAFRMVCGDQRKDTNHQLHFGEAEHAQARRAPSLSKSTSASASDADADASVSILFLCSWLLCVPSLHMCCASTKTAGTLVPRHFVKTRIVNKANGCCALGSFSQMRLAWASHAMVLISQACLYTSASLFSFFSSPRLNRWAACLRTPTSTCTLERVTVVYTPFVPSARTALHRSHLFTTPLWEHRALPEAVLLSVQC